MSSSLQLLIFIKKNSGSRSSLQPTNVCVLEKRGGGEQQRSISPPPLNPISGREKKNSLYIFAGNFCVLFSRLSQKTGAFWWVGTVAVYSYVEREFWMRGWVRNAVGYCVIVAAVIATAANRGSGGKAENGSRSRRFWMGKIYDLGSFWGKKTGRCVWVEWSFIKEGELRDKCL